MRQLFSSVKCHLFSGPSQQNNNMEYMNTVCCCDHPEIVLSKLKIHMIYVNIPSLFYPRKMHIWYNIICDRMYIAHFLHKFKDKRDGIYMIYAVIWWSSDSCVMLSTWYTWNVLQLIPTMKHCYGCNLK